MERLLSQWRGWKVRALAERLLICVIVGAIGTLLWALLTYKPPTPRTEVAHELTYDASSPVQTSGVSYKTYRHDRLLSEVYVGEFKVHPRSLFGFRVKPFNEAVVKDLQVTIYAEEDNGARPSVDWFPLFNNGQKDSNLLNVSGKGVNGLGIVTRGVIQGITVKVIAGGTTTFTLAAVRGTADLKQKHLAMSDVVISRPHAHQVIRSKSVVWDQVMQAFTIPGDFIIESPTGVVSGRNWKFDMGDDGMPRQEALPHS